MTTSQRPACDLCGHPAAAHVPINGLVCHGAAVRYIASASGPGMQIPTLCNCPGYQPKEETMSPESAPPPAPAAPAASTTEVALILEEMRAAYLEVHAALEAAHGQWAESVAAAHATWQQRLEAVAARAAHLGGGGQAGGTQ